MKKLSLRHLLTAGLIIAGTVQTFGNPTGGQVTSGAATITTIPGTVTINQSSNIAIINWQTFSISSGELTQFVQPCASSAALNRVLGGGISTINGTLTANGQVYLINGNGVVVGPSGVVTANTFIASTRDIADADFLSGDLHFTGTSSAGVQNFGVINAIGGDVYLIGKTVDNQGTINAACGTAGLASGDDVVLNLCGQEHVFVNPSPTTTGTSTANLTAVHNSGTISAASAELKAANGNMFALAINNEGTIRATSVSQKGGRIFLTTDSGNVQNSGTVAATNGYCGGQIKITGGSVWNRKTIDASGIQNGGSVTVNATNVQNDGTISVVGSEYGGGEVYVTYSGNALGSIKGVIDASGRSAGGVIDFLGTGATSEAYLSLKLNVNSTCGTGGSIDIDTPNFYLTGATLTANGATGGGRIFLGQGDPATSPTLALAQIAYIGLGTTIQANATSNGDGGQIGITSTVLTQFSGTATAKAKGPHNIGMVTITGPMTSTTGTSTGTTTGTGTMTGTPKPSFAFTDPDPTSGDAFGRPVTGLFNLSANTTLITSPGDNFGGAGAGAAYLFSDTTGALLSTIRGSHANDGIGTTVSQLTANAFTILSPDWNGHIGAITFGNGTSGFAAGGGAVSSANSLIGNATGDEIGSGGLIELFNGDFLILSPNFNGSAGAVTWVNPTDGITGVVNQGNSLVGATSGDNIGSGGIDLLSNGANYLVLSPNFNGGAGAITNGSDGTGVSGIVSASNSLVGASSSDAVGLPGSIDDTGIGYYLVRTVGYGGGAGAVTWNNSSLGTTGVISASNSLVGTSPGDHVGNGGITVLYNGDNYVVSSPDWNGDKGAVTLGVGATGIFGTVSASNSLVGAASGDHVGSGGIIPLLDSENFAILTPDFDNNAGAFTLASNTTGVTGVIGSSNSLVGATSGDQVGSGGIDQLNGGNIVVLSPHFNSAAGAVTFVNVGNGISGIIGSTNSLVGESAGDNIGSGGIQELSNGENFLVYSPNWQGTRGAITNGDEFSGVSGIVNSSTSLVGAYVGDRVGSTHVIDSFDGYYLAFTPGFKGDAGAVTWSDDSNATTGVVSFQNSLVSSSPGDNVGSGGITVLFNGNYVIDSPGWGATIGAVTFGNGTTGVRGFIGANNSLLGSVVGDAVGSGGVIQLNSGGHYLVLSPSWTGGKGAITNISSTAGLSGLITSSNSLIGASAGDHVGSSGSIVQSFNGYYLALTPNFNGGAGAVTWSENSAGTTGIIGSANSLVGTASGDHVGSGGITLLDNGNYIVDSPNWNAQTGAVTLADGTTGLAGYVSATNSLVGAVAGDAVGDEGIVQLADNNFLVLSDNFNANAGAVTWGNEFNTTGFHGVVTSSNSLVGANPDDTIGSGGIQQLSDGTHYLVLSPTWGDGKGAITEGSDATGVIGVVGASNSLVGASIGDLVGTPGTVLDSDEGYYLVTTGNFSNGAGAVTWSNDSNATTGVISASNSLVGTHAADQVGSGGITFLNNGNYVVNSPDWNGGMGAVTLGSGTTGISGAVSSTNSLVGATGGDHIGSYGLTEFLNGNFLVLSPDFNGGAGAITFVNGTSGLTGVAGSTNSLVGAASGDSIGSGGITFLGNDNYLVLSPDFNGGAGAVTFGTSTAGVTGTVGAANSLVGIDSADHIGSGGIIQLSNGNYLVQSPLFNGSAGAVTWGSELTGVKGTVSSANSITGGGPDSGEEFAGESANGNIYLVSFTTDTSAGGDGRVIAGSVDGPASTPARTPPTNFFIDPAVITFEASNYFYVLAVREFYIADPSTMGVHGASVDSLQDGAINNGYGNNLALGSSTSGASGPRRLVTPINGIWNIFSGTVHSAPAPAFISQQLQLNLSPEVYSHLNDILFGRH